MVIIEIVTVEEVKEVHNPIGNCKSLVIFLAKILVIITINHNSQILAISWSSPYPTLTQPRSP